MPGTASETDQLRNAIAAGNWPLAEFEAARLADEKVTDPVDYYFLVGMLAQVRNQPARAAQAFRKALAIRPEVPRIRLELAQALFNMGDDEAARFHFERVLAAELPDEVADNVRNFLARIRQRRGWLFDLSLGYLSDSNANSASRLDTLQINGLVFQLDERARQTTGEGMLITASASYTGDHGMHAWGELQRQDYTRSEFDDMQLRTGAGIKQSGPRTEWFISPLLGWREYGNAAYSREIGLRTSGRRQLSTTWWLEGSGEWTYQHNFRYPSRSGSRTWLSLRAIRNLDARSAIALGVDFLREGSDDPQLASTTRGLSASYFADWPYGISAGLTLNHQRIDYDERQPIFDQNRQDRRNSLTLRLANRHWQLGGFMPVLSISRIENHSGIAFFGYQRTVFQILGERRF